MKRLCWVLCLCAMAPWLPAWAADAPSAEAARPHKASKGTAAERKSKPAPLKLTAPGGSGETPAERSARLRRECKGRPNAGACTGYTN